MTVSNLSALLTFTFCLPAALLITHDGWSIKYRLLSASVLLLGLAKLSRYRPVADTVIEPLTTAITGIHNIPIAIAITFAIGGYSCILLSLINDHRVLRWTVGTLLTLTISFLVTFPFSYGSRFSGRISEDGITSPVQIIFWSLPLFLVLSVNCSLVILCAMELRSKTSSVLLPAGVCTSGVSGIVYATSKVAQLVISSNAPTSPLLSTATLVSLLSLPFSAIAIALVVYSSAARALIDRLSRYRSLRKYDSTKSRRESWIASRTDETAYWERINYQDSLIIDAHSGKAS